MPKPKLNEADFSRSAARLAVPVASVKAVCQVEAPKGGFLPSGEPTILFERHKFSQFTRRKFDKAHPDISNRLRGGYLGGAAEHKRLQKAAALDRVAALKSASWGKFQIMGFNHAAAGFADIQAFINAMYHSEGAQLDAFVNYILAERELHAALKARDWAEFARRYNGEAYAENAYDTKLAAAYRRFGGQ